MATLKSTTLSDGTTTSLHLTDNTRSGANKPSSTGNKLYANTTSLYWEDDDIVSGGGGGAADKSSGGNAISNSAASDTGPSQGYRMHPGSSTTFGITARANTFMHGTFYNELVVMGDVEAPGLYIRGEGTDNSQAITEQGPTGHTLTVANETKYENTVALPWATTSIYFDGTADKITAPQHKDFQMLDFGDYTVELWVQHSDHAGTEVYIEFWEDASNYWQLQHVHGTGLQFGATTAVITDFSMTGTEIADTLWHHVAVVKSGFVYSMYLDGALVKTVTAVDTGNNAASQIDTLAATLQIGDSGAGSEGFQGYMAEIRLTKGMARYTENFVPPQGYLSARMASFAIDATTFNSTESPTTLDVGARDRLGEDTLGDGHVQVTFKENYTINSTAYMIPIEFKNSSDHEWSLNNTIWPRAIANTYMRAATDPATIPVFAASAWYGNRAVFAGTANVPGGTDSIEYVSISAASEANAADFGGELTEARYSGAGLSNGSRGCFAGGDGSDVPGRTATIDYIPIGTLSTDAVDFGDLTVVAGGPSANMDGSRGVRACGELNPGTSNVIDYITISTTGNAKDFGDHPRTGDNGWGASNGSRGISAGFTPPYSNIIEYLTIATTGNTIDFGDMTIVRSLMAGTSDGSRGVGIGGYTPPNVDTIDYINIGVIGNAVDFGNVTGIRRNFNATTNGSRALYAGGNGPTTSDAIEIFVIGYLGNAVDYGELGAVASAKMATCSGD